MLALLLLSGCGGRLDYDALGIHEPVVVGGQREIDQGHVVEVDLPGIWLAGHRTAHGAVFAALPHAQVGDTVCVYGSCYHVARFATLPMGVLIQLPPLGPVVLQTSLDADTALLVVAE